LFSAPNYCGEFDNAGAMMTVDETLMCSFQILKPAEQRYGAMSGRPNTPPRKKWENRVNNLLRERECDLLKNKLKIIISLIKLLRYI